jgi:hypothetical protein
VGLGPGSLGWIVLLTSWRIAAGASQTECLSGTSAGFGSNPDLTYGGRRPTINREEVRCNHGHRTVSFILRQAAPARMGSQGLRVHWTLDLVQAAGDTVRQNVSPDAPGAKDR